MRRTLWTVALLALVVASAPATSTAAVLDATLKGRPTSTCDPSASERCVTELIAGQNLTVGAVSVEYNGDELIVTFEVTEDGWYLTETHLYVGSEPPSKTAPGQFPFQHEGLHATTDAYTLSLSALGFAAGDCPIFAAHAVVERVVGYEPDLAGLADVLPDSVTLKVAQPGGDSYFNTTLSGGTVLDGTWDGWCIDTDRTIWPGNTYTADVYSSYETLPDGLVEYPENLDLVNYIINQGYVGQPSSCDGAYTSGDVQRAIWELIEDNQATAGLGPWSQCRVDEILADAYANGEGFVPGGPSDCGLVAVILRPTNIDHQITIAQVTLAAVPGTCTEITEDETAWGFGPCEFDKKWGWYFSCCVPAGEPVKVAGVRFRSFGNTGGNEVYVGVGDLGVGGNRVEKGYTWTKPGSYPITFTYDPAAKTLVTTGDFGTVTYNLTAPLAPMDSCEVIVADRDIDSQVNFVDVSYNGVALDPDDFIGNDGFAAYPLAFDGLDDGFTFEGTVEISGPFSGSQEKSRVEILCGQNLVP
jgi:hypothetical protein